MSKSKGHHAKDLHAKGRLAGRSVGKNKHAVAQDQHCSSASCLAHKHVHPVRGMILIALAAYIFGSLVVTASVVDAAGPDTNGLESWSIAHVQQPAQMQLVQPEAGLPAQVEIDAQPLEYYNGHWDYLVSFQMSGLTHPGFVQFGNHTLASNVVNDGFVETGFTALAGQTYTLTFTSKLDGTSQVLAQQVIQVPLPDGNAPAY